MNRTNDNRPWAIIQDYLSQKYRIIGEIDLLNLDSSPHQLMSTLKQLHRLRYSEDEKILVYHYDTDYYLGTQGLHLHNFLKCLQYTDISPSVFIMMTNHYGIEKEISDFYQEHYYNHDYSTDYINVFSSNYQNISCPWPVPKTAEIEINRIDKKFICLCGADRSHRKIFLSYLAKLDILNQGICSWNFNQSRRLIADTTGVDSNRSNSAHSFLSVDPFTRVNDFFPVSPVLSNSYNNHHHLFATDYRDPSVSAYNNPTGPPGERSYQLSAIKNAFLYVSVETVFQYPYPYFTEKTFNAILNKRPFVVLGAPSVIKQLKNIGFRSFNEFWDESYDSVQNPSDRLEMVADIVHQVANMSIEELKDLCYHMQEILDYNYDHYVNAYSTEILDQKLRYL